MERRKWLEKDIIFIKPCRYGVKVLLRKIVHEGQYAIQTCRRYSTSSATRFLCTWNFCALIFCSTWSFSLLKTNHAWPECCFDWKETKIQTARNLSKEKNKTTIITYLIRDALLSSKANVRCKLTKLRDLKYLTARSLCMPHTHSFCVAACFFLCVTAFFVKSKQNKQK